MSLEHKHCNTFLTLQPVRKQVPNCQCPSSINQSCPTAMLCLSTESVISTRNYSETQLTVNSCKVAGAGKLTPAVCHCNCLQFSHLLRSNVYQSHVLNSVKQCESPLFMILSFSFGLSCQWCVLMKYFQLQSRTFWPHHALFPHAATE